MLEKDIKLQKQNIINFNLEDRETVLDEDNKLNFICEYHFIC